MINEHVHKRRRFARIPVKQLRCSFLSGGIASTNVSVVDISLGGAFLRTSEPLPVGESLSLELPRAGEPRPLSLLGRVVFRKPPSRDPRVPPAQGVGVCFDDVDSKTHAALRQLLQSLAPNVSLEITDPVAETGKRSPVTSSPTPVPSVAPAIPPVDSPEVVRLKIQVKGLLMEIGELQSALGTKDREIEALQKAVVRLQVVNAELARMPPR
jgi:hypothetical protein